MWKLRLIRALQRCLFFLPVKKNRILFYVNKRRGFGCNPKYVALEMLRRFGAGVELIWATDYPETCGEIEKLGIRVVRAGTKQHWLLQLTSGAVVVNDAFHETVVLRRRQVTVNTWHASMNYKKIGPGSIAFRDQRHRAVFDMRNVQPDVYVSGSRFFTQDTSASFGFAERIFLPAGTPRNDILFQDNAALAEKIRARYGLGDKRLALYAPTFRQTMKDDTQGLDFARLAAALGKQFGGEWMILYRKHYFVSGGENLPDGVADVSDYDDMSELLAVVDVLVSDYSSCLWDFSMTMRPAFVFAPDMEAYGGEDRGFAYPPEKWPYPLARNNNEMESRVLTFDAVDYREKIQAHHADAGTYDDGHASRRVADCLAEKLGLENKRAKMR